MPKRLITLFVVASCLLFVFIFFLSVREKPVSSAALGSPIISGVSAIPAANSVTITWTTDILTSSQVRYNLVPIAVPFVGPLTTETDISPRVTSHTVTINSLQSCVRYYYQVKSIGSSNNGNVSIGELTFSTTGCAVSSISTGSEASVPTTGGSVSLTNAQTTATVTAPASYTTETTTIQVNKLDSSTLPAAPTNKSLAKDNVYDLSAVSDSNTVVSSFTQPVSFVITYGADIEAAYDESTLKVYKYIDGVWTDKGCALDTVASTLTCSLSGFSTYGLFGVQRASSTSSSSTSSAPTCNDSSLTAIPDLFQIDTTKTQATLYFTPIPGNTKYYIIYSTNPVTGQYGAELNLGSEGVQSYTVNLLSPRTTYYFKVRGQKGCATGGWSGVRSATTKGYQLTGATNQTVTKQVPLAKECSYTVKKGDTLWAIAEEMYSDPFLYPSIVEGNQSTYPQISDPDHIDIGWSLKLRCK